MTRLDIAWSGVRLLSDVFYRNCISTERIFAPCKKLSHKPIICHLTFLSSSSSSAKCSLVGIVWMLYVAMNMSFLFIISTESLLPSPRHIFKLGLKCFVFEWCTSDWNPASYELGEKVEIWIFGYERLLSLTEIKTFRFVKFICRKLYSFSIDNSDMT